MSRREPGRAPRPPRPPQPPAEAAAPPVKGKAPATPATASPAKAGPVKAAAPPVKAAAPPVKAAAPPVKAAAPPAKAAGRVKAAAVPVKAAPPPPRVKASRPAKSDPASAAPVNAAAQAPAPTPAPPTPRAAPPPKRGQVLILQGGGALGAYECGVYRVLAERLDNLRIVAGTSIGAINAGVIARNFGQADRGVAALAALWEELTFPAIPGASLPGMELMASLGAVMTSVLVGNPSLFQPTFGASAPYSTEAMRRTVARHIGTYARGTRPRLMVTAVELESSQSVAFDSDAIDVTPDHIVASSSLPPGFPPTTIDGRHYWDGGLWSNTPLPDVLAALRAGNGGGYDVYIVDAFPRQFTAPDCPVPTPLEVQARMGQIIFQDKTRSDATASTWVTWCRELYDILASLPSAALAALDDPARERQERALREYRPAASRVPVKVVRIGRASLPYEQVSCGIDFSADRIGALIEQGARDAGSTLTDTSCTDTGQGGSQ